MLSKPVCAIIVDTMGQQSRLRIHRDSLRQGTVFTLTQGKEFGASILMEDMDLIQIEHPRALVFNIVDRLERMIQREEMEFIDG